MVKDSMDLLELLRKRWTETWTFCERRALMDAIMDVSARIGADTANAVRTIGLQQRLPLPRVRYQGRHDALRIPKLREGSYFPSLLELVGAKGAASVIHRMWRACRP